MMNFLLHVVKLNIFAAVFILLALLLPRVFQNRYSVKWRYFLWIFLCVILLFPFNIKMQDSSFQVELSADSKTLNPKKPSDFFDSASDFDSVESEISDKSNWTDITIIPDNRKSSVAERKQDSEANVTATHFLFPGFFAANTESLAKFFIFLWLLTAIMLSCLKVILYYAGCRVLFSYSVPVYNSFVFHIFREESQKLDLRRTPVLRICSNLKTPLLAGIFHSKLYLPKKQYSEQEYRFIFRHELCHFRRKDLWYKFLLMIVTTLYWFNPALYLMKRTAENDLEFLCDAVVVQNAAKTERLAYNRLLLQTASEKSYIHSLAVSMNDNVSHFKKRMVNIMKTNKLKSGFIPLLCLILLFTSANLFVGCTIKKTEKKEPVKKIETEEPEIIDEKPDSDEDTAAKNDLSDQKGNSAADHNTETQTPEITEPDAPNPPPAQTETVELSGYLQNNLDVSQLTNLMTSLGFEQIPATQHPGPNAQKYTGRGVSIEWAYNSEEHSPITVTSADNDVVSLYGVQCGMSQADAAQMLLQNGWLVIGPPPEEVRQELIACGWLPEGDTTWCAYIGAENVENPTSFALYDDTGRFSVMDFTHVENGIIKEWIWLNWPQGKYLSASDLSLVLGLNSPQ